ncbi:MAG: RsmF rRNA methyltransferase first C-terminal domain-containing protein [Cellulosilyticaceae bacterium]
MNLPIQFQQKMQTLLGAEYEDYLQSYELPKYQGIRINTLKMTMEEWEKMNPFSDLESVPWCEEGYYYIESKPSKHPYYYAGLYYIQEPSAMSPGAYIPIEKGDKVLDLCAAPGGKSTQVAAKLGHTGLLVSNDISTNRAKALVKNLENFGVRQMMVVNEAPENLARVWPEYFDKILIDAPCSGEGMFRKDDLAIKSWETHGIDYCTALQEPILEAAATMLKAGGMMLYSTCTFSPEENEVMIDAFLKAHPSFRVVPLKGVGGIQEGRPEWCDADPSLKGALRLWPHHMKGEGHFLCLLQKTEGEGRKTKPMEGVKRLKDYPVVHEFITKHTTLSGDEKVMVLEDRIFLVTEGAPTTKGLRMMRSGMLLGHLKNKRFEPSHMLGISYPLDCYKQVVHLQSDEDVLRYLKGETLLVDAPKGYHIVAKDGHPLGWVKSNNGALKNQYPPTWRLMG